MRRDISDEVVIVTEYDPLSAAGVERLKAMMGDDLSFTRTWILLNKMLPEFVKSFSEFLSVARYLPPIPWTADVVRAYSRRRLALDFETGNHFTLGILQTLKALLPHADGILLDKWAAGKAASLRQPIEQQYKDHENKLKYIYAEMEAIERRERFTHLSFRLSLIFGSAAALVALATSIFPGLLSRVMDTINTTSLTVISGIVVAGFVSVIGPLLFDILTSRSSARKKIERDKLSRQRQMVEDEIKKLESLKDADLGTIVERASVPERS